MMDSTFSISSAVDLMMSTRVSEKFLFTLGPNCGYQETEACVDERVPIGEEVSTSLSS